MVLPSGDGGENEHSVAVLQCCLQVLQVAYVLVVYEDVYENLRSACGVEDPFVERVTLQPASRPPLPYLLRLKMESLTHIRSWSV